MTIFNWFPEFQQMHKELFNDPFLGQFVKGFGPRMDISETNELYIVRAEVPGYSKNDIELDISGGTICISGHFEKQENKEERMVREERIATSFSRCLSLPFQPDPSKVTANLKDGILEISLAKSQLKGSKISIQ
jgi:HSP20 family protein